MYLFCIRAPGTMTLFEGNGSLAGFFRVLKAALAAKEYDVIHAHSPHLGLFFLVAARFFRRATAPAVITVHDSYQNYQLRNRLMVIPVFAGFRRVICCGGASYDSFPALYRWLAGDRMVAVRNGLDLTGLTGSQRTSRGARPTAMTSRSSPSAG
jgi:glycosyltransferase involved in cell wall biosynthesis